MLEALSMSHAGEIVYCVFLLIVGIVLIVKGGDWFVDSASKIAELSGVPQFIIGATIVSVGTTLPELITSSIAASEGSIDIAIGNAVGSVNANIGLIMAVSLLFMPHAFDKKAYLFKGLTMVTAVVVLFLMCLPEELNAYLSIILLVIFFVFMAENIIKAKKEAGKPATIETDVIIPQRQYPNPNRMGAHAFASAIPVSIDNSKINNSNAEVADEKKDETNPADAKKEKTKTIVKSIIMFIIGAAFIVGGAQHLVTYGTQLANFAGIPERIIAITIVAIGTSLPELVTTITSIVKKKHDLSIGNIIGANVIDICLILPICAMITGGVLPVQAKSLYIDMPFCIAFAALAIIPSIITKKFSRVQGGVILATYIAYMVVSIVV